MVNQDEVVEGDVVAIGGSVRVDGQVTGNAVAIGGSLTLGPKADVPLPGRALMEKCWLGNTWRKLYRSRDFDQHLGLEAGPVQHAEQPQIVRQIAVETARLIAAFRAIWSFA